MPIKEIIIGNDKEDRPEELLAGRAHGKVFTHVGYHFKNIRGAKNHLRTYDNDRANDDGREYFAVLIPTPMWGDKAVHIHWAKAEDE